MSTPAAEALPKRGTLTRKVGGLPVYMWGALVLVATLGIIAWRMKAAPDPSADAIEGAEGLSEATEDGQAFDDLAGLTNTGGFAAVPTVIQPVTGEPSADTNDKWARRSIEWLTSQEIASITDAQKAIQLYLDGEDMSYQQATIRDKAIQKFGLPPELPGVGNVGAKPSDPAKKQGVLPRRHLVKNANENTFAELALLYYNRNDSRTVDFLQAANPNNADRSSFPIGQYIYIPKYVAPVFVTAKSPRYDELNEIARKNGIGATRIRELNPGMKAKVKSGTKVRVK